MAKAAPHPAERLFEGDHGAAPLDVIDPLGWVDMAVPPRRWAVTGWIPWGNVTLLTGDGGTGKSLIVQTLLTAAATGKNWLGLSTTPCRTLGIFCEDDEDELHRRHVDICRRLGVDLRDVENLSLVSRVGGDNIVMVFDNNDMPRRTKFFAQLMDRADAFGAQLIAIDTAADVYGGNENFRPQVRAFINSLRDIAQRRDGAVILTAHPSKDGLTFGTGLSGSTAWHNSVRSRIYLTKATGEFADPNERILRGMKSNYGGIPDEIKLLWADGTFVREDDSGIVASIRRHNAEDAFMIALDELTNQGRHVNATKNQPNYAPRVMVSMRCCKGHRRQDIERAMAKSFDDGKIEIREDGPPSRPRRFITRTEKNAAD